MNIWPLNAAKNYKKNKSASLVKPNQRLDFQNSDSEFRIHHFYDSYSKIMNRKSTTNWTRWRQKELKKFTRSLMELHFNIIIFILIQAYSIKYILSLESYILNLSSKWNGFSQKYYPRFSVTLFGNRNWILKIYRPVNYLWLYFCV